MESIEKQADRLLRLLQQDKKSGMDAMIEVLRALPAKEKVEILNGMGLTRHRQEHATACESRTEGIRCNCMPPESMWRSPVSVRKFFEETWDDRAEYGAARQLYENDGIGSAPPPWLI